jgi:hypothetical protein
VLASNNAGCILLIYLAVTAIGRPSGMNATAALTQETMSIGIEIQLG